MTDRLREIHPVCSQTCDGGRYQIMEGAHIIDCWIKDSSLFSASFALAQHKRILEQRGLEVIKFWPEYDYKPPNGSIFIETATGKFAQPETYFKNPPYLFLVKEKQ